MKAELKINSINQIIKGTEIYVQGEEVSSLCLVVKGRVRIHAEGVNLVVGSGNFLGLCDLPLEIHQVTYEADTNAVVFAFAISDFSRTVRTIAKVNKDYSVLMVSTLSKYIRGLWLIYDGLKKMSSELYSFLLESHDKYLETASHAGVKASPVKSVAELNEYTSDMVTDKEKIAYYISCCDIPSEVQKGFFGFNMTISLHHIKEQVEIINKLITQCEECASYIKDLAKPLIKEDHSLYIGVWQLAMTMQHMQENSGEIMSLFDDIVDKVNNTENYLYEKCAIDLEIDHEFMEDAYYNLLNGTDSSAENDIEAFALTEESHASVDELNGSLSFILEYSELDDEKTADFNKHINDFMALKDKSSTEDDARTTRRGILKIYYDLYKAVFLKDYNSSEDTPLIIDLFLRYGFISEKL